MADFAATVGDFARRTEAAHRAIFRKSVELVLEDMLRPRKDGGNLPVDTGFLRASLVASLSDIPMIRSDAVPEKGATYTSDDTVNLVIATAELGDTIYAGFVAAYARRLNYGFSGADSLGREYNQFGYLFLELAVEKWEQTVAKVEAEIISALGLN